MLNGCSGRGWDAPPTPGRKGACFGAIQGVTLTPAGIARLEAIWRRGEPPARPAADRGAVHLAGGGARHSRGGRRRGDAGRAGGADQQSRPAGAAALHAAGAERRSGPPRLAVPSHLPAWRTGGGNHGCSTRWRRCTTRCGPKSSWRSIRAALDLTLGDPADRRHLLPAALAQCHAGRASVGGAAGDRAPSSWSAHPDYPPRLRGKLLQAADDLFRSARIVNGWGESGR